MYPPLSPEPSVVFAKEQPARSEVQAVAGASATLSCEVAQAQTEVTWYKDGKKLSSSSKVRVEATGRGRPLQPMSQAKRRIKSPADGFEKLEVKFADDVIINSENLKINY